eukprot:5829959-Amphidinium_carterae.1
MVQRESGSDATEDRETIGEYNEEREREIDNEFELSNEYNEIEENKETMEYSEYVQTIRICSETNYNTIHMIKMNIKLPNPTVYDG